jgi:hypothetical protein
MTTAAECLAILALLETLLIHPSTAQCVGNNEFMGKMPETEHSICKNSKGICYYMTLIDCPNPNGCAVIVHCDPLEHAKRLQEMKEAARIAAEKK